MLNQPKRSHRKGSYKKEECNPDSIIPKGRGFIMASLSITSLLKRVDELRILLDGQYTDIRAINETRLDGSISD